MSQETTSLLLHPKKSFALRILIVCSLGVAGGIWMAQEIGWIGYLFAGLVALGLPVAVVQLLPGSAYLRITEDGLSVAFMFRVKNIPWNVIDHFFVVPIKQFGRTIHKMVGFNSVPSYDRAKTGRRMSSAIAHYEGGLPDTYGMKAEELADLLNRCLSEFTKKASEQTDQPKPE